MSIKLTELPYQRDSASLFTAIAQEPWSVFLDSGYPKIDSGRYDIITSRPIITLTTVNQETTIHFADGAEEKSQDDPFALVKQHLGEQRENLSGLPFCGGALGYFSYDLGRSIERIPVTAKQDINLPDMAIGIYDWAVLVDHHQRRTWLVSYLTSEDTLANWQELVKLFQGGSNRSPVNFSPSSKIVSNMDKAAYGRAFDKIQHYIREGDCYQVNLAQRYMVDVSGSPWDAYLRLRKLNPAPFAAFMNVPGGSILSSSPERFLKVTNDIVETKPIKGTRRRSSYAYEDKALAVELLENEKERAENLMIVDLLRNDLGKTCITGSVSVPKLFALETYATVHHLVSTITGRIKPNRHVLDLLRGCFPGGSITGAPKLRSMEIIEELEPHRRSVYCGSIGYIGFDRNMDCNIAIRTLVYSDNKMYCWAGGGITVASNMDAEYQECYIKAAALLQLMEFGNLKDMAG